MSFPEHVWKQIKNKTCDEIISALEKDGGAPHRRDRIWILSHTGQQSTWGEGNRFDHQQPLKENG